QEGAVRGQRQVVDGGRELDAAGGRGTRGVPGQGRGRLVLRNGGREEAVARAVRGDLVARRRGRRLREPFAVQAEDVQAGRRGLDEHQAVRRRGQHGAGGRDGGDLLAALDVEEVDDRVAGQPDEGTGGGRGVQDPPFHGGLVAEPEAEVGQPVAGEDVPHDDLGVARRPEDGDDPAAAAVHGQAEQLRLPVQRQLVARAQVVDVDAVAVRPGHDGRPRRGAEGPGGAVGGEVGDRRAERAAGRQ